MRKWCRTFSSVLISFCLIGSSVFPCRAAGENIGTAIDKTAAAVTQTSDEMMSYREYADAYRSAPSEAAIAVDISRYIASDEIQAEMQELDGRTAVVTGEEGKITWTFTVL